VCIFVVTDDDNEDVFSDEEFEAELKQSLKKSTLSSKDSEVSSLFHNIVHWPVASPGFGARRGTKLKENNLRVTQNIMKFVQKNSDKAIGLYISFTGQAATTWTVMESNVRVCAGLK